MKAIIFALALILLCSTPISAKEIELKFTWDPNENVNQWTMVKIFVRMNDSEYDYSTPLVEIPQTYQEGLSFPIVSTVNFNFPENEKTTAYFVARSYDDSGRESESSNEVIKVVDLTPLAEFSFTAEYDSDGGAINFQWAISDVRTTRYRIYKSSDEFGEFEPFKRIDYVDGQTNYSESIPIDELFPDNQRTTVYFKMAGWAGEKPEIVQSPYTDAIPITIDRRTDFPLDSVINFKLILE